LNYEGQIILLQKQKLFFPGEQALAPRNFVAVEDRWTWSSINNQWEAGAVAHDGFAKVVADYTALVGTLPKTCQTSPLAVERALELLMGPKGTPSNWFAAHELDAIHLDLDEESIRRVTVHQELNPARPGVAFRQQRLQRAHDAIGLARCDVPWPGSVRDLADGFEFSWKPERPHHNVVPSAGERGPAAMSYLGDQAADATIDSTHAKIRQAVVVHAVEGALKAGKSGEEVTEIMVRAEDRVCVVFRRDNRYHVRGAEGGNLIDAPAAVSPVDVAGAGQ
jgi:hypothetical protein